MDDFLVNWKHFHDDWKVTVWLDTGKNAWKWLCRCHLAGKTRSNDLWALDAASRIGLSCASTTSVECFPKTEAVNPSVTDKSKYIPLDVPEPTRWVLRSWNKKSRPPKRNDDDVKDRNTKVRKWNTELLPGESLLCAFFWSVSRCQAKVSA